MYLRLISHTADIGNDIVSYRDLFDFPLLGAL